jgi:pyruvate kinase
MLDVKGREIRVSETKEKEGIRFKFGDKVLLRSDSMDIQTSTTCIQIDNVNVLGLLR